MAEVNNTFEANDGTAQVVAALGVTVHARDTSIPPQHWISVAVRDKDGHFSTEGVISLADAAELRDCLTYYLGEAAK